VTTDVRVSDNENAPEKETTEHKDGAISGLAPLSKLVSLKVMRAGDRGQVSYLLAAIGYLQTLNAFGRNLQVHGLNLSLGYPFRPEWFAAGQSPLCVEVDRLVKSVVVVVAASNGGYSNRGNQATGQALTIDDPGNADLAITVGSTHRNKPHTFGVSFFSGKGPTADGRMKPDLVAPGERVVSCALMTGEASAAGAAPFVEKSGTSMAAPHISGVAAAFLSVRREFIGTPQRVKEILQLGATDLKRRQRKAARVLDDAEKVFCRGMADTRPEMIDAVPRPPQGRAHERWAGKRSVHPASFSLIGGHEEVDGGEEGE